MKLTVKALLKHKILAKSGKIWYNKNMSYDILLFDADRTLFDFDKSEELAFLQIAPLFGVEAGRQNYQLYRDINHRNWEQLEKGLFTKERILVKRFEEFLTAIGKPIDSAPKMHEVYTDHLSKIGVMFDEALPMIERLYNAGKRLFIITNGVEKVQKGRVFPSPIFKYLENIFISEVMGVSKPQKKFFDLVAEKIPNFYASKTIVIGDSLTSDIRGANNAGLDCIWFNPENSPIPNGYTVTYNVQTFSQMQEILLK